MTQESKRAKDLGDVKGAAWWLYDKAIEQARHAEDESRTVYARRAGVREHYRRTARGMRFVAAILGALAGKGS